MEMRNIQTEYWGLIPYRQAWERQTALFDELIAARADGKPYRNRIIFCEHPPVYTLGRHGKDSNMLLDERRLAALGAELIRIDRGGDITFHGPGQVVCYPILCLDDFGLGLKAYISLLEEAVIRLCARYGIEAGRSEGATGVWIKNNGGGENKICAIGVRSSRFVTMHGLALNVSTNLQYFSYIHPCGFTDRGVTSLEKETGLQLAPEEIMKQLAEELFAQLK